MPDATPETGGERLPVVVPTDPTDLENRTLPELADILVSDEDAMEDEGLHHDLRQGAVLSAARKLCEDPNCGIEGRSPDNRFGEWLRCAKFAHLKRRTLLDYRKLHENFGHLPHKVLKTIGRSNLYTLGRQKDERVRVTMVMRAAILAAEGRKYSIASFASELARVSGRPSTMGRATQREAERVAREAEIARGDLKSEAMQELLWKIRNLAGELPNDEARFVAITYFGMPFPKLVRQGVKHEGRARVAMSLALALHYAGLWGEVLALRHTTAPRPLALPPPADEAA